MFKYQEYENTDLWKSIDHILEDLEENSDIQITTARKYVIGYFCETLQKKSGRLDRIEDWQKSREIPAKAPDIEAEDFDKL